MQGVVGVCFVGDVGQSSSPATEVSEATAQEFSCCCHAVCGLDAELPGSEWPVPAGHDVDEKVDDSVAFCGLVADEVGYLVVENVQVTDGG